MNQEPTPHKITTHKTPNNRYDVACTCGWSSSGTFTRERTAAAIGSIHAAQMPYWIDTTQANEMLSILAEQVRIYDERH
jgi:hypothetical protein